MHVYFWLTRQFGTLEIIETDGHVPVALHSSIEPRPIYRNLGVLYEEHILD